MLVKDLPENIQKIVFQRQVEQGNNPNSDIDLESIENNFDWHKTIEGGSIWDRVSDGRYDQFCEFHRMDVPKMVLKDQITDIQLDSIIENLDDYARSIDSYEYGLPGGFDDREAMRDLIRNCLKNS